MQEMDQHSAQKEMIDLSQYDFEHPELASPREVFFLEWAEESVKQTVPYLNEVLQKLITTIIAILGAALVATKERLMPQLAGIIVSVCLLAALVCAVAGVWPRAKVLPLNCADLIEQVQRGAVACKALWIRAALVLLCIAVAGAIIGFTALPAV